MLATVPTAQATYLGHNGKIAYTRGGEVWTMDLDGSNQAPLVNDAINPAWSADGRRLAFGCRLISGAFSRNICTANADGTSVTALDNFGYGYNRPSWSPDGLRFAVDNDYGCSFHVCYSDVWRINSGDGSDGILMGFGLDASWGVNGLIAFYTRRLFGSPLPSVLTDITLVNPRAPSTTTVVPGTEGAGAPDWSPDGERLVIQKGGVSVVNPDGSNLVQLTADGHSPAWSPDGTRIVFGRGDDLWVMNADGTGETQLTDTPNVFEASPAMQPLPQAAYATPAAAEALRVSLVPAFERCTEPNRGHGPPLAFDSCAPPVQGAGFMTFGSAPKGAAPRSVGHVRLEVIPGDPDSVNRADVKVSATLRDVRRGFDLADGPGSLELVLPIRLTDLTSGPFNSEHQATVRDLDDYATNPLRFLLPCVETSEPAVGSTCSVDTTVNALFGSNPGAVRERRRAIWQLDQIAVWDGGEDGFIESRDDNTVLAVQGVFVP